MRRSFRREAPLFGDRGRLESRSVVRPRPGCLDSAKLGIFSIAHHRRITVFTSDSNLNYRICTPAAPGESIPLRPAS